MQIVFGKDNVTQLREKYTVLELEEVKTPNGMLEPYCVIPVEHIALNLGQIGPDIALHEKFVDALKIQAGLDGTVDPSELKQIENAIKALSLEI